MEKKLREARREYESHSIDVDSFKMRLFQIIEPQKRRTWTLKKIMLVTASVLTFGFSTGFAVSPSFANYVSSFLKSPLDPGVENAATKGYTNVTEASATDEGITVTLSEVVADPARLIVSTTVKSKQPDVSPAYGLLSPKNKLYLTDEKGNVVAANYDSYHRAGENGYYQFVLNDSTPKKLQLHLDATEIRLNDDKNVKTGKWNITVPIDMEKSVTATHAVPLNQTHTSSNGFIIQAKSISYTPSAARLTLESSWTPEGQNRIDQFAKEIQATDQERNILQLADLYFRILDHEGKVVASSSNEDQSVTTNRDSTPPLYQSWKTVTEGGKNKNIFEIVFVPSKSAKGMTFEMLGSSLYEPARFQIDIDPQTIKKNPITKQKEDAIVTVTNLSMQKNPVTGKNGVALDMTLATKTLKEWEWFLTDESNKRYTISMTPDSSDCSFSNQVETCKSRFFIKGMTQLPKKATLGIRLTKNSYKENDVWKFELPANAVQK